MKKLFIFPVLLSLILYTHAPLDADAAQGRRPKNIILMISDGCGYNQIDAASLYQYGKTGTQIYEAFPVRLGMSTYTAYGSYDPEMASHYFSYLKEGMTDSAAAATAMGTGVKTYRGAIGVDINGKPLKNVTEVAEAHGLSTGVVTTVPFSHATPAGFVAHNRSRDNYREIANYMIYESALEVIIGCGAPDFDNSGNEGLSSISAKEVGGPATYRDLTDDNRVLGSDADHNGTPDEWQVIRTREAFWDMASGDTPLRVIGLPQVHETLQQKRRGDDLADPYVVNRTETVPTLAEMSQVALNVLDNNRDGFFLMIEGGAVDWAGHDNQSGRLIEEEIDFNRAVEAVAAWIEKNSSWDDTLLIVTADHETGYLNGPGSNPDRELLENNGRGVAPGMEWHSDEHTNQLIPFFAKGAGADIFNNRTVGVDPVRGAYIDNTTIGKTLIDILSPS